ncbi:type II CRISPR RNA-guided endonuclease Cas9 [Olsenella sp. Marseille-QA0557]|uniref:type II CRISPR RNA-guided endonuclease Cas9 n=1 Tax=Olsenella sp. Marseille-QA0557 TaxID=3378782 RepID=UPI003D1464B4
MNLRKATNYSIGLDLGTGSVGWAAIDEAGNLLTFKKKAAWGSRLFPSANPASVARIHRGQRRRYERRRQRLDLLQALFSEEMQRIDPDFFVRMNQSRLHPEDRAEGGGYRWPFFNDSDFTEKDYYKRFPTIYHLRSYLCLSSERADIRLIYLAFHNIVKCRGNFLYEDMPSLSACNSDMTSVIERFSIALQEWCDSLGFVFSNCDISGLVTALQEGSISRRERQERVQGLLGIYSTEDSKYAKALAKGISNAVVGLEATFSQMFPMDSEESYKFSLESEEKVSEYIDASACPDEAISLFESIRAVYSAFVLSKILRHSNGGTISQSKIAEYEKYKTDLALLKDLIKTYAPQSYKDFFGGTYYPGTKRYDPVHSGPYTRYNLQHGSGSYQEFKKAVKKLLDETDAILDSRYGQMLQEFDEEAFLWRLKTSDNGSIPYQLHLEEMTAIIEHQAPFYPFLQKERKKLESLVSFRIPYYVGPLTTTNAAKDRDGHNRFAWAERKAGKEDERVYPWNWDKIIDRNKSAEKFIRRMTGICTYLQGEPVLPKSSLLYEEFCMLNEFNGSHWTQDGDTQHRFDEQDRQGIIRDLFRKRKVTYKQVEDWMCQQGHFNVHVSGGQGETGYESKLSSYIFFSKDILHVDEISLLDYPMIEEIILWNTLFEDRLILREKIEEKYGDRLDTDQIKKICKKRFTGWGRLSKKLLTGIKAKTDLGNKSIMDILREGNSNNGARAHTMVFMEVLRDDKLRFQDLIDEENRKRISSGMGLALEELPGSPALRRSVNQALRIVDEITGITKCAPANIFIEYTRNDNMEKKGTRTKRRYDALTEAVRAFKRDNPDLCRSDLLSDLKETGYANLDERLTLYFMQGGKSLYSRKPIDIRDLGNTSHYQIDHIIPQSYMKDDSFENKALVLSGENQRKSDAMLIDESIRKEMGDYWRALHNAGLIGNKKYNNLMRSTISDNQMRGFIARQLVETSQIVKSVALMLESKYPTAHIHPIKASLSSQLRDTNGYVKCREVNDYHHAHDALLACEIGRFITLRHPDIFNEPIKYAHAMREFIKRQNQMLKRSTRAPGNAPFIIASFMKNAVDEETGEIYWDAAFETERIRRYLEYKDCYITRMPEETSGEFWKTTIYSPYGGKRAGTISLKQGLAVEKYGGYSSIEYAHFALYLAKDKKGKDKLVLTGIPIPVLRDIRINSRTIDDFFHEDARNKGLVFIRSVRDRLLKYSRVNVGKDEYYVPALDALYSSKQLVLSAKMIRIAALSCDKETEDSAIEPDDLVELYDVLTEKLDYLCSKFSNVSKVLLSKREVYLRLPIKDKRVLISNLLKFCKASTSRVDLSLVGGPKHAGRIQETSLTACPEKVILIDQSVTGMFERRMKLEL